jgi:hypothetical protein
LDGLQIRESAIARSRLALEIRQSNSGDRIDPPGYGDGGRCRCRRFHLHALIPHTFHRGSQLRDSMSRLLAGELSNFESHHFKVITVISAIKLLGLMVVPFKLIPGTAPPTRSYPSSDFAADDWKRLGRENSN